jgi:hypothetical protein
LALIFEERREALIPFTSGDGILHSALIGGHEKVRGTYVGERGAESI